VSERPLGVLTDSAAPEWLVLRRLVGLIAAAVLSAFAALLLNGRYRAEGPVVLSLTATHGIHRGDILIAGGWLIGMIALAVLVFDRPSD
jgi:hypothetical protein